MPIPGAVAALGMPRNRGGQVSSGRPPESNQDLRYPEEACSQSLEMAALKHTWRTSQCPRPTEGGFCPLLFQKVPEATDFPRIYHLTSRSGRQKMCRSTFFSVLSKACSECVFQLIFKFRIKNPQPGGFFSPPPRLGLFSSVPVGLRGDVHPHGTGCSRPSSPHSCQCRPCSPGQQPPQLQAAAGCAPRLPPPPRDHPTLTRPPRHRPWSLSRFCCRCSMAGRAAPSPAQPPTSELLDGAALPPPQTTDVPSFSSTSAAAAPSPQHRRLPHSPPARPAALRPPKAQNESHCPGQQRSASSKPFPHVHRPRKGFCCNKKGGAAPRRVEVPPQPRCHGPGAARGRGRDGGAGTAQSGGRSQRHAGKAAAPAVSGGLFDRHGAIRREPPAPCGDSCQGRAAPGSGPRSGLYSLAPRAPPLRGKVGKGAREESSESRA
ncbi:proline-rich protein 36-like [Camarhynchus parvulus]|uniref:proline-rich protein 36-like n=1 Tax=Geospiza parvula TaxID=87175 RepID=UPI0012383AAA|nr:proline-rich protein 36-like [Camarhynchus parvulus]